MKLLLNIKKIKTQLFFHLVYMNYVYLLFISLVSVFCFPINHACSEILLEENPSITIKIKKDINIKRDTILLKDIADIECNDDIFKKRLGKIKISKSPSPGKQKIINPRHIKTILTKHKLAGENTKIISPEFILITRMYQTASEKQIKRLVINHLKSVLCGREFEISRFKIKRQKKLALGSLEFEIINNRTKNIRFYENLSLILSVKVDGIKTASIPVSCKLKIYEDIVHTAQYYPRGTILKKEYLYLKKTNILKIPKDIIRSVNYPIGKQLKTNMKKDTALRRCSIKEAPLVKKGSTVKLVAEQGLLSVTAYGIAKSNAAFGQMVKVENLKSKKIVTGTVKDAFTVNVLF